MCYTSLVSHTDRFVMIPIRRPRRAFVNILPVRGARRWNVRKTWYREEGRKLFLMQNRSGRCGRSRTQSHLERFPACLRWSSGESFWPPVLWCRFKSATLCFLLHIFGSIRSICRNVNFYRKTLTVNNKPEWRETLGNTPKTGAVKK